MMRVCAPLPVRWAVGGLHAAQYHPVTVSTLSAGLSPEAAIMYDTTDKAKELTASPAYNILRPETVESFFYLWRVTGDPVYQEWGWR
jgi:Glycosyl hydrolase family 47